MNISAMLPHTAVYWPPSGTDGYGKVSFANPVEVSVRWQMVQEEFADKDGRVQRSNSVVYCKTSLKEGGYLYKGSLSDLTQQEKSSPISIAGSAIISKVFESSSIDGSIIITKVLL